MEGDIVYVSCSSFILQLVAPLNPHRPENPQANQTSLEVTHWLEIDTLASHLTLLNKLLRFHFALEVMKYTFLYDRVAGPHSVCSQRFKLKVVLKPHV